MKFYRIIEALDNKRSFMLKIKAMTKKQMVEFIKKIKPYVKNGKINSTDLNVTEKVDGSSIKIAWFENEIYAESSYSGMIKDPNEFGSMFGEPFAEVLRYYQKTFKKDFISKFKDVNFKVVGELFYTKNMEIDDDGSVTFVTTKYDAKKLGNIATIVAFEALEYDGESFTKPNKGILKDFLKISDKNLDVIYIANLKFNSDIQVDVPVLQKVLDNPELIAKDNELLINVREALIQSFSEAIKNSKKYEGDIKSIGSVIEGIVMDFDGMKIAFQNPNWYKKKKELWFSVDLLTQIEKEFFFDIIGKKTKASVKKYIRENGLDATLQKNLKNAIPILKEKFNKIKVSNDIPKNLQKNQISVLKEKKKIIDKLKYNDLNSLKKFINMKE
jgi:hypothetical protein